MSKGLSEAMRRTLMLLDSHAGEFQSGYGRSAFALMRRGLARRKFTSKDGEPLVAKFAITESGRAALASRLTED